MIKCKRYCNKIKTKLIGNQRSFLDQFSDNGNIWKGSKNVLNYNYFEKTYNITQEQAYDLIMINENKICPICNKNKRKFINYFSGYETTCDNEMCKSKNTINSYIIYRFISPQNKVFEYPNNKYATKKSFAEYICKQKDIVCPICKKHDLVNFDRNWARTKNTEFLENNRLVRLFDASDWICGRCKNSICSKEFMLNMHYGTSKKAKKFQKTIRDPNRHYKFSKQERYLGGINSKERIIEYSKSDIGRETSRKTLIKTWQDNYDYMHECSIKNLTSLNFYKAYILLNIKNLTETDLQMRFNELLKILKYTKQNINNQEIDITILSSWRNLLREWYRTKDNVKVYVYYAYSKSNTNIIKIGITERPTKRYSVSSDYYNLTCIKECDNRYIAAYIEYKLRTLFCKTYTEITNTNNLQEIIDYVNSIKYTKSVKEELELLGWTF